MAAAPGRAGEASDGASGSDEVIDGITGGLRDDDDDGRRQQQQHEEQQGCHGRWKEGSSSTAGRAHEDEGGKRGTRVDREDGEGGGRGLHLQHRHRQQQQHQQNHQWQQKGCSAGWQGGSSSAAGRKQGDVGGKEGGGTERDDGEGGGRALGPQHQHHQQQQQQQQQQWQQHQWQHEPSASGLREQQRDEQRAGKGASSDGSQREDEQGADTGSDEQRQRQCQRRASKEPEGSEQVYVCSAGRMRGEKSARAVRECGRQESVDAGVEQRQPRAHAPEVQAEAGRDYARRAKRAGASERAEWSFRRGAGAFHKDQCGTGGAAGSRNMLDEFRGYTLECRRSGCGALVDRARARAAAQKSGRTEWRAGDGCGSRRCSGGNHSAARFKRNQAKMARELGAGGRQLIRWPADIHDTYQIYILPAKAARAVAAATLERHDEAA